MKSTAFDFSFRPLDPTSRLHQYHSAWPLYSYSGTLLESSLYWIWIFHSATWPYLSILSVSLGLATWFDHSTWLIDLKTYSPDSTFWLYHFAWSLSSATLLDNSTRILNLTPWLHLSARPIHLTTRHNCSNWLLNSTTWLHLFTLSLCSANRFGHNFTTRHDTRIDYI